MLYLDPGEKIVFEVRKHWLVFVIQMVPLVFGIFVPPFVYAVIKGLLPPVNLNLGGNINALLFFLYALWLLGLWIMALVIWTNYYLDVWYVTEKRIIDINQKGIFNREISNLRFDKVQDITLNVRGFIATFLDYGDILVETAADMGDFVMKNAARPEEARRVIFAQHNEANLDVDKPL